MTKRQNMRHRNQDKSEVEHLKGIIREQDKQIRILTKRLKHAVKREHLHELQEQEEAPIILEIPKRERCLECHRGFYNEFEICDKVYGTCDLPECGHRKRLR
jgi:vacuolar-type H+-ATPase subunit F/Vma7